VTKKKEGPAVIHPPGGNKREEKNTGKTIKNSRCEKRGEKTPLGVPQGETHWTPFKEGYSRKSMKKAGGWEDIGDLIGGGKMFRQRKKVKELGTKTGQSKITAGLGSVPAYVKSRGGELLQEKKPL